MKRIHITTLLLSVLISNAQTKPRARELGIPFEGTTGKNNAITDVPGIEVGYKTLIEGNGKLDVSKGPVRTGVTVILPKGKTPKNYPIAWYNLNGDGEMTGVANIEDYGLGYGPIGITNTNSVGTVRDAIGQWNYKKFSEGDFTDFSFGLPIVAETWDGMLNDINGFHVKTEHVWEALDNAKDGPVQEGNIGGGTGMALYLFKGGNGTASRTFTIDGKQYTLGVFIQANFGGRSDLMIAGVPVGKEIKEYKPILNDAKRKDGSAIVIIATDAPLLPSQLKLVAKRVAHGIARTGTFSNDSSGEIFLALSTAEPITNEKGTMQTWKVIPKEHLNPIFKATVQATEEAIINTLIAAEDMEGINNNKIFALPHEALLNALKKYNRLKK
ncbi:P1 family peptidase [Flavobacterium sp. SM15]|uniref:DmpA family aminopeptidase n=1 Tax=Flavobacterium sp. SM15 TaxID=2908005 RepID=UPI001EDB177B|nr:P1 family peptidase [Flavobacterium sp. SM15]MCG2611131.1 P1 family peptidase [Flavobacterium sp. SM15]